MALYNENQLNYERLEFIIENCTNCLTISSSLIKTLMENNNKELLELLFKKLLKFFDNEFILNLLNSYKNHAQLSDSDLYPQINSEKFKFSVELNEINFEDYNSSYYLFNACRSENKTILKSKIFIKTRSKYKYRK